MNFYRNSFLEFSCSSYWILAAISPRSSVLNWRFLGYEFLPRFHSGFVFKCSQSTFWELFLGFLTEFLLRFLQESFMRFLPETQTKFFQTCFRNFSFFSSGCQTKLSYSFPGFCDTFVQLLQGFIPNIFPDLFCSLSPDLFHHTFRIFFQRFPDF